MRQTPHKPARAGDKFQSTHSLRSATLSIANGFGGSTVSIHALLAECDSTPGAEIYRPCWFQSTHSLRSATGRSSCQNPNLQFQSTHSLRSATQIDAAVNLHNMFQSTHSLRSATWKRLNPTIPFWRFQSTHSLRSATAPDHIHCYSTAQTILCANLPKKAIIT